MIIGHRKIVNFFKEAMAQNRLAQAYCLVGPESVGKRKIAQFVAGNLLGVSEDKLTTHPDYYYLSRLSDEKTGKLKKDISIGQAREMRGRLQNRSWLGGYQITVIDEAELLNEESGNALLKILEEPGERSVFFLLTEDDSALLSTVRSRCQLFNLPLVAEEEIFSELKKLGHAENVARESAAIAWGRPGRAINFAENQQEREDYLKEVARWEETLDEPFYLKLKSVEDLFGDKTDHIRGRDKLQATLDLWMMLWRQFLISGQSKNFSPTQAVAIIDRLREAKRFLGQNIHPRLLVEETFLNF